MPVVRGGGRLTQALVCLSMFTKDSGSYLSMSFDLWDGECRFSLGATLVGTLRGDACSCVEVYGFHRGSA